MTKKKNQAMQEQPTAALAPATETTVALAPNGNAIVTEQPKEDDAQGNAPDAEQPAAAPADPRVLEMQRALRSYPTLPEGYITSKGVYFDKAIAEKSLEEGEELIIVEREDKQ